MTQKPYYYESLNRVLQHIDANLGDDLNLQQLAQLSHFSPFHFQRIFKALVGENPYEYILNRRLERAVFMLKHRPKHSVTTVAYDCGFPSPENFSRQFKARYGFTASQFRKDKNLQKSKIYQEDNPQSFYLVYQDSRKAISPHFEVAISEEEAIPIALIRATFGADGSALLAAYHELIAWTESVSIPLSKLRRFGMSIDDPNVTPSQRYRYDFAVANPEGKEVSGRVEEGEIPGGLYVSLRCTGDLQRVAQAWDFLYRNWLPESGYVPRHYPAVEAFLKGPEEIGWDQFDMRCSVPIQKL